VIGLLLFQIVPITHGGRNIALTFENRAQYYEQAIKYRLQEFDLQVFVVLTAQCGSYCFSVTGCGN